MKRDEYCIMIREVMRGKSNPTAVAHIILRDTGPEDWKAMACIWIESYVRDRQRADTLNIERSIDRKPRPRPERKSVALDSATAMLKVITQIFDAYYIFGEAELRKLVAEEVAAKNGERITWGEADIDFHRERIAMLNGNALAQLEAVARHECAIRTIEHYGVSCLNEVLTKAA